jgi:hypothetical protein
VKRIGATWDHSLNTLMVRTAHFWLLLKYNHEDAWGYQHLKSTAQKKKRKITTN